MPVDLPHNIVNGTVTDASEVMDNLDALKVAIAPLAVGTLPPAPADGDECFYRVNSSVTWHLKFIAADGHWAKVGGPALIVARAGLVEAAGFNYGVGPIALAGDLTLTVPLAGKYDVRYRGDVEWAPGSGVASYLQVGLVSPAAGAVIAQVAAPAADVPTGISYEDSVTVAAAGVVRVGHGAAGTASGFCFYRRLNEILKVNPLYVS